MGALGTYAGSTARFEQSFRAIADSIEIPGRQDPKANVFRLVHDWLRGGKSGQWLLILDNVDDPDLLPEAGDVGQRGQGARVDGEPRQSMSAYLPRSQNGSILVTSRSKAVALKLVEEKDIVVVQPMAPAQALTLFEKKLGSLGQGDDTAEYPLPLIYFSVLHKFSPQIFPNSHISLNLKASGRSKECWMWSMCKIRDPLSSSMKGKRLFPELRVLLSQALQVRNIEEARDIFLTQCRKRTR